MIGPWYVSTAGESFSGCKPSSPKAFGVMGRSDGLEPRNHVSRVLIRTENASYVGNLVLPTSTRLKEFINRNDAWISLSDAQVTNWIPGKQGIPERVQRVVLRKRLIEYVTLLSQDVRPDKIKVYERDVLGVRMRKGSFSFHLGGGIMVSGEVIGGEKTITYHRGGFLAVTNPIISDLKSDGAAFETKFVLINIERIESYEKELGAEEADLEPGAPPKMKPHDEPMDFSDFENQFIKLDKVIPTTEGQDT